MKRILIAFFAAILLFSCSDSYKEKAYLDFLYEYMPLPDRLAHDEDWWRENVRKTLEVRNRMAWDVPEREFRHFVLPLRVNNEFLDDFRLVYADSLCARVEGMTMEEAAIEINHWCHEYVTYRPSDARTSSPLATMRAGLGRCGEESVFAVAAMRAAGIPARQVYTPRWAHTDDNHAWIEVFVDGNWHFMGACEPEPVLDLAWFNAPVSRAMLLHTRVFGDYHGDEDVISRNQCYTEINVIKNYVPSRRNVVTVLDTEGRPVVGANVKFQIYNYAEFYTVASYISDSKGQASLDTGLGDLVILATSGDSFGMTLAGANSPSSVSDGNVLETKLVLDRKFGDSFVLDFDIDPPVEQALPSTATEEQTAANAVRLAREDEIRNARPHGNAAVLDAFRSIHADAAPLAEAIINSLSVKDLNDVTMDVLEDAYAHCGERFDPNIDAPRVEYEALLPYMMEIGQGLSLSGPREVWEWVCDNVVIDNESNPQRLRIPPLLVWRSLRADDYSRDIFFVALCRALGFPARLDEVTGKIQYLENEVWNDVKTAVNAPQGTLALTYEAEGIKSPAYYTHFSLTSLANGSLLSFNEYEPLDFNYLFSKPYSMDEGPYLLTTGRRLANGGVLARAQVFNIEEAAQTELNMLVRKSDDELSVLGSFDAEKLFLPAAAEAEQSILSATGRGWFMLGVLGTSGDEPSNHAIQQFGAAAEDINDWGCPLVLMRCEAAADSDLEIQGLENVIYGVDKDDKVAQMLREGVGAEGLRLPVIIVGDSFGRIVYFTQGYNTSLAEDLRSVFHRLQ